MSPLARARPGGPAAILVLVALLGACGSQPRYLDARSELARALRLMELDRFGQRRDISNSTAPERPFEKDARATRVPAPDFVDLDSTIEIQINKDALQPGASNVLPESRSNELTEEKNAIIRALDGLTDALAVRATAIQAYDELRTARKHSAPQPEIDAKKTAFDEAKKSFGQKEEALIQVFRDRWEAKDPKFFAELDQRGGGDYSDLRTFLEGRLRQLDDEQAALASKVESKKLELRISAALETRQKQAQIHIPGYDDLEAGQVVRRDRLGLALDSEDRARLQEQWQSTVAVSEALERYRKGEQSFESVLRTVAEKMAPELRDALDQALDLRDSLSAVNVKELIDGTREDIETLAKVAERSAATLGDDAVNRLKRLPKTWQRRFEATLDLESWLAQAAALAQRGRNMRPENLVGLLLDSQSFAQDTVKVARQKYSSWFVKAQATFKDLIAEELKSLAPEVLAQAEKLLEQDEAKRLMQRYEQLRELWTKAGALVATISELMTGLSSATRSNRPMPDVSSLRVPLDELRDTRIDLMRTPRRDGDDVRLRAELFQRGADKPIDEVEYGLGVRSFGWNARLSPGVVLVQPTKLQGREETFAFAPVLSWVHRYTPRPEDSGIYDGITRFLDLSYGIHASFVNFDADKEVEIGLGVTVSLWRERVQLGAGVNLMATSDNDGMYYFFVGSDLISLLNTVGLGESPPR